MLGPLVFHFDYGHFVDAHDIPEVFMLSFSL